LKEHEAMKKSSETVGQAWIRELSLFALDDASVAAFEKARGAVLTINPALGLDSKALYFAAQGWMAAQQHIPQ
jgi:hypothetical protein